ncbi:MAG TPA: hypothetical protein VFH42_00300, partial [Sporolactobacillaceae bacterium]|nr:hypothetical protein [Sporolactobacillaceae bacterium]
MSIGHFTLFKRKTSPYLSWNEPSSAFSGKISAYFTITGYSIKGKTSNVSKKSSEPHLDASEGFRDTKDKASAGSVSSSP